MIDTERSLYIIKHVAKKLDEGVRDKSITSIGTDEIVNIVVKMENMSFGDMLEVGHLIPMILRETVQLFHVDNSSHECKGCCAEHICGETYNEMFGK